MKTYNSSDLNNKRSEILEEAAANGVVIQEKKTNGEVRREFLLIANTLPSLDNKGNLASHGTLRGKVL